MFIKASTKGCQDCWINSNFLEEIKIVRDNNEYKLIAFTINSLAVYTLYKSSSYEECKEKAESILSVLSGPVLLKTMEVNSDADY